MPRELLRPQFDTPLIVSLDFGSDGIEKEGKHGVDYMYTCNNDDAIMFLPPDARNALRIAGVQPGEEIALIKRKAGKQTLWEIQRVEEEPDPRPAPPRTTRQLAAAAATRAAAPAPSSAQASGAVVRDPATVTQPARPTAVQQPTATAQLAAALCAAIDAAVEAETYANRKGLKLQMSADDIRAMALSIYIGNQRKEIR